MFCVLFICMFLATAAYAGPETTPAEGNEELFSQGARHVSVTAGRSVDDRLGRISLAKSGVYHYFKDGGAVYYGLSFGYADAKRTRSGFQGGPELGARWHFMRTGRWSSYLDGSVGAIYHQYPLKENTLRFNFDLQAGAGLTYRLFEKTLLQGGFCWHHLSNARIRGKKYNYGYDAPMLYLGLMKAL